MHMTIVPVEKLGCPENWLKMDDQKCIRIQRKSFVGHPSATFFPRDLSEGVFQQARLIAKLRACDSLPQKILLR
jgi:hypothetical protein